MNSKLFTLIVAIIAFIGGIAVGVMAAKNCSCCKKDDEEDFSDLFNDGYEDETSEDYDF